MVSLGSDAKCEVEDMHLSRYACFPIVQNADPSKEVVALGQTYFAVQTRRQEISDAAALAELTEDRCRLLLRQRIKLQNSDLASATKNADVIFQNHGYRALYNGQIAEDIHKRKKLKKSQHILDHREQPNWQRIYFAARRRKRNCAVTKCRARMQRTLCIIRWVSSSDVRLPNWVAQYRRSAHCGEHQEAGMCREEALSCSQKEIRQRSIE